MRLKGKVAVITGGSGDIGREVAVRFAKEGAIVAICDLDDVRGAEILIELQRYSQHALFQKVDVTNEREVQDFIQFVSHSFGHIDILCNNAGVNSREQKLVELELEEWQHIFDVNVTSTFLMMKYAIPQMPNGGSIVNVASIAGMKGQKRLAGYSSSKGSAITLTKVAAAEYGRQQIRVNAISPGVIDTQMVTEWKTSQKWQALSTANALKRVGKPEEVANAILFLASDEASFVTGATLVVDGGTLNL